MDILKVFWNNSLDCRKNNELETNQKPATVTQATVNYSVLAMVVALRMERSGQNCKLLRKEKDNNCIYRQMEVKLTTILV